MNLKFIFPDCPVKVVFKDMTEAGEVGSYDPISDKITLCSSLAKDLPICGSIVLAHEIFHSTGHKSRSLRRQRLSTSFEQYAYEAEECIVEIATMVLLTKYNMLNQYSRIIPEEGLRKYYSTNIYIPWSEVVSALNCYKAEDIDFTPALEEVRDYLTTIFKLNIKDRYEGLGN